jgi:hypothetical protein
MHSLTLPLWKKFKLVAFFPVFRIRIRILSAFSWRLDPDCKNEGKNEAESSYKMYFKKIDWYKNVRM